MRGYVLETDDIARILDDAKKVKNLSEIHIVSALHPSKPFSYYVDVVKQVKAALPDADCKAFTPVEVVNFAKMTGKSIREVLEILKEAGLDSLPGGGAEILSDRVRQIICPKKATADEWLGVARTALYRYFKTKRDIFDEAIHEITSGIRMELERIRRRKDLTVSRKIGQACDLVIDELYGKREFFSAIYEFVFSMVRAGEDMTSRIESFTVGFKVVLRQLVADGVSNGELRRGVDPEDAAEALFALMESVAFRLLLGVERDARGAKERFSTMIAALHD